MKRAASPFCPHGSGTGGFTGHAFTDANGRYRATVCATPLVVVIRSPKVVGFQKEPALPGGEPEKIVVEVLTSRYSDRLKTELRIAPVAGQTTVADFILNAPTHLVARPEDEVATAACRLVRKISSPSRRTATTCSGSRTPSRSPSRARPTGSCTRGSRPWPQIRPSGRLTALLLPERTSLQAPASG